MATLTPALYPVTLTPSFQAQQAQSSMIDLPNLWNPYMVPYNSCDQDQSLPIPPSLHQDSWVGGVHIVHTVGETQMRSQSTLGGLLCQ